VALLEKRGFLYNHSGDFPQVILIVPSHVPNNYSGDPDVIMPCLTCSTMSASCVMLAAWQVTGRIALQTHLPDLQMALAYRLVAISQGPKNSRIPGPNPLILPLVMDMHTSKTLCTGLYKS
jgi:hypothetical protein